MSLMISHSQQIRVHTYDVFFPLKCVTLVFSDIAFTLICANVPRWFIYFISLLKNKTAVLNGVCRPVYLQGSGLVPSNLCGVANTLESLCVY